MPFSYNKESEQFVNSILEFSVNLQQQRISYIIPQENMQNFHHGTNWINIIDDKTESSSLERMGIELKISHEKVQNNDINQLFTFINDFVEGFVTQMSKKMYQTISDSCDKVGNVVRQTEGLSKADIHLKMLRKIEFSVNKNGGIERPQLHLNDITGPEYIKELESQDESFHNEMAEIIEQKEKEAIIKEKNRLNKYKGMNL